MEDRGARPLGLLAVSSLLVALASGCNAPATVSARTGPTTCGSLSDPQKVDVTRVWFERIDHLLTCAALEKSDDQAWALRSRAARLAGKMARFDEAMGWECARLADAAEMDREAVCPPVRTERAARGGRPDRSATAGPASASAGQASPALPRLATSVPVPPIPPARPARPSGSGSGVPAVNKDRGESVHGASVRGDRWVFGDLLDQPIGGRRGAAGPDIKARPDGVPAQARSSRGYVFQYLTLPDLRGRIVESTMPRPTGRKARVRSVRCVARPGRFHAVLRFGPGNLPFSGGVVRATGHKPNRLYLDFDALVLGRSVVKKLSRCAGGVVSAVRSSPRGSGARIVFDVPARAGFFVDFRQEPFRVTIDFWAEGFSPKDIRVVALDPGHGGRSKGAVGPGGLAEKVVTLAVARYAARFLRRAGLKVVLTRNSDRDRSLEDRTAIALAEGADVFVSIHANSDGKGRRQAVETYYLDMTDDDYAKRLAKRENEAAGRGVSPDRLTLAAAVQSGLTRQARGLAWLVQHHVIKAVRAVLPETKSGGVRKALFAVLLTARVPAILVEMSYISHPKAEKALGRRSFQKSVGRAIAQGILEYRRLVRRGRFRGPRGGRHPRGCIRRPDQLVPGEGPWPPIR